jgi:hypothetical protein
MKGMKGITSSASFSAFIPSIPFIPVHSLFVFIVATGGGERERALKGKQQVAEAGCLNSRTPKLFHSNP